MTIAYSIAATVGTVYVAVTVLVISIVGTAVETGYYGASYRIFTVLGYLPVLLVGSAFPILSRAAKDDRLRLGYALQRLLEIALILGVWVTLCTSRCRFLIDLVAGPGFEPAVAVLEIQAFALIATFLAATLSFALLSERRHNGVLVSNAIALAISVTVALALVPSLGAKGAAVATVVGESSLAVAYAIALFARAPDLRSRCVCSKVLVATALAVSLVFVQGSTASCWQSLRASSTSSCSYSCVECRTNCGRRSGQSGVHHCLPREAEPSCPPLVAISLSG